MKVNRPQTPISKNRESELRPLGGNERILVVDDEPFLVRAHKMQLTLLGYRVTATTDSEKALQKIKADPQQYDLLLTDQIMPGLTGVELACAVQKINPSLPVILCTGQGDVFLQEEAFDAGIREYVSKPIFGDELFHAIREVLDGDKKE